MLAFRALPSAVRVVVNLFLNDDFANFADLVLILRRAVGIAEFLWQRRQSLRKLINVGIMEHPVFVASADL